MSYTRRHLHIINEFLANKKTDCKKLLEQLGSYDANDLAICERWLKA